MKHESRYTPGMRHTEQPTDKVKVRRSDEIFSRTHVTLEACYENFNAPIVALLSELAYEQEMKQGRKLNVLRRKIVKDYG